MKRLFIGIPVQSETALHWVDHWCNDKSLNENRMTWTNPPTWHVTLFFLGATPWEQVALLEQMIKEAFSQVQPFTTNLNGVGVFPEIGKPRVLWMGLYDLHALDAAYSHLGKLLQEYDLLFDPKPLKPHLTLARVKNLVNRPLLDAWLKTYRFEDFGPVDVNRVTLFESLSTPSGVIYQPLFERWLMKVYG